MSLVVLVLAVLSATGPACNLGSSVGFDAGTPEAGADGEHDGPGEEADSVSDADENREPIPGPLTLLASGGEVLTDRLCDLDGDGGDDNALADLGNPGAALAAAALSQILEDSIINEHRFLLHAPRVDDVGRPETLESILISFLGFDTDRPEDPTDDFSGTEPFWAREDSLDSCGEPNHSPLQLEIRDGELSGGGGDVPIPLGDGFATLHNVELTGHIEPLGEHGDIEACGALLIADLGRLAGAERFGDHTLLEVFLAGGAALGMATMPGINPDLDLDGDGLERFTLDDGSRIESCIDGDTTVIEGRDCWSDDRMADGYAMSISFDTVAARFAGRGPNWEYLVAPGCDGGPPEPRESLWYSPAYGSCAETGGSLCDPLAAGNHCCDSSHQCSGQDFLDYRCWPPCEPRRCVYGEGAPDERPGHCLGSAGADYCWPLGDPPSESDCVAGATGCVTEHGVTAGTICVEHRWLEGTLPEGEDLPVSCHETCEGPSPACEDERGHICYPLRFDEGGVCVDTDIDR